MAVRVTERCEGRIIEITVTGTLHKEDYEHFMPMVESTIQRHDQVRMVLRMVDFNGWTLCAAWEDLKFDLKHFRDIERLAFIGDRPWEKGMAQFCRPFTSAEIRYFTFDQTDEAYAWIEEALVKPHKDITSCGSAQA